MSRPLSRSDRPGAARPAAHLALAGALLALAACGGSPGGARPTQVVAKVNDDELSVHQVNFVLQRTPGIPPERAAEAKKQILERLIDQELAVQKAREAKLDRDPDVVQRLEAARREILAQAYIERAAAKLPRPTAAEIASFHRDNPGLFAERRVWTLNEIVLSSRPDDWAGLSRQIEAARSIEDASAVLRARGIEAPVVPGVMRASEGVPLEILPRFSKLKVGDVAMYANGPQVVIAEVRAIRSAPVDAGQSKDAIERFLATRARMDAAQAEVRRLRDLAKIEYRGEFAGGPGVAPPAQPPTPVPAAGAVDGKGLEKGIGGLK